MTRARLNVLGLATAILITSAGLSLGQEPQPSQPRTINLSLIVIDHSNHSIDDLQKDELRVFENNVPQTVVSFSKVDKPVDYGVAIDSSGSVRPIFSTLV